MTSLVSLVADKVSNLGVKLAYGEPVEIDGKTIVPVAVAYVGFGAGSGNAEGKTAGKAGGNAVGNPKGDAGDKPTATGDADLDAGGELTGEGGGGGGASFPIGAYVNSNGTPVFEPNLIALTAVLVPLVWVTGKAIRGIIKAAR